jgi:hypothetical protein
MDIRKLSVIALAGLLPLFVGCKPQAQEQVEEAQEGEAPPATSEQEIPGVGAATDVGPVEGQMWIDDVTIGHELAADGTIPADKQGDDFAPGQPIHISMETGDAPAGSAVKVAWYGPGETKVGEETKNVVAGQPYLTFTASDTAKWPLGDYRAEVWTGDEKVNTQQFQIVEASQAGK